MKKRMTIMLLALGILFGLIILYKVVIGMFIRHSLAANQNPVVTVSAMQVKKLPWQPQLKATGSVRAIKGVDVTTSLSGQVQYIYFKPGSDVKEGTLLVRLNADAEIGQLDSLRAQKKLAEITYHRDLAQLKIQAVSKQQVDSDLQNLRSLTGQVAQQAAIVEKKFIRAPFSGHVGINVVNPGQFLNTGDKITSLQTRDPMYVDFPMPQQYLAQIKVGQLVSVTTDTYPGKKFFGKITTIDPALDNTTRNVTVEATVGNPDFKLTPGMFTAVEIETGQPKLYLTLPQTAVSYNPYGDIVYLVLKEKDEDGKEVLTVKQNFVVTGETRGEQVTILKGLKEGETVVTSGQLKLKNGSRVTINNKIVPPDKAVTVTPNEH